MKDNPQNNSINYDLQVGIMMNSIAKTIQMLSKPAELETYFAEFRASVKLDPLRTVVTNTFWQ